VNCRFNRDIEKFKFAAGGNHELPGGTNSVLRAAAADSASLEFRSPSMDLKKDGMDPR